MENANACSITPGLVEARLAYATSGDPAQRDGRFLPEILSPLVPVVSRLAASAYRRYLGGARYCDHPDAAGADEFAAYCLFYLTKRLAEGAPGMARLGGEPGAYLANFVASRAKEVAARLRHGAVPFAAIARRDAEDSADHDSLLGQGGRHLCSRPSETPEATLDRCDLLRELRRAAVTLPPDQARVIFRRAEGAPPRTIAAEMGCSAERVYELARRAKQRIGTLLA